MEKKDNGKLLDRIEYYLEHPEDERKASMMFSAEEQNILRTIREFEKLRYEMAWENKNPVSREDNARFIDEIYRKKEKERDISFRLKKEFTDWIDILLKKGGIEAWIDILIWYRLLKEKNLIVDKFWELPILGTMLNAFIEELKRFDDCGSAISILAVHSLEELTDIYFHLVFLLRRVEYEVEPQDEILDYLMKKRISFIIADVVLEDSKIWDKEKVRRTINGWVENWNE